LDQERVRVVLVTVLLLSLLFVDVGQVWALSVTPDSPTAGQPFTVNSDAVISETIYVYAGGGCSGALIVSGAVPAGGRLAVPGQPYGQYSTNANFEVGCFNFTVIPPPFDG